MGVSYVKKWKKWQRVEVKDPIFKNWTPGKIRIVVIGETVYRVRRKISDYAAWVTPVEES